MFNYLVNDMIKPFKNMNIDKVVGLDALGFILGSAIAQKLKVGLVLVRKGGKLPGAKNTLIRDTFTDYTKTKKIFEMNNKSLKKGEKVLIVDEWIETGSQMKSAIKLIEKQGGKIIGITSFGAEKHKNTQVLFNKYNCQAIRLIEK